MRLFALLSVLSLSTTACATSVEEAASATDQDLTASACLPKLECAAPALPFAKRAWRHGFETPLVTALGEPRHRGRDFFVNPGAPQTVIGKFAYGLIDKDIHDEDVDVFVQRDCGSDWEKLGTARTTDDGQHVATEGVEDDGGRIFFEIPADKALGPGKHRIRMVVAGDGSWTDSFLDVVPRDTPIFVSDVDGTLTSSENVEFVKLLTGGLPETHPGAPEALRALVAKGYRPMYVTARPEWLTQRTRDFLAARGFPEGVVHTSTSPLGAGSGSSAASYKKGEMALLAGKGLVPAFGFGNKTSDSDAYAPITDPQHRFFYQISGAFTGHRIDSYEELVPSFSALSAVCK